MAEKNEKCEKKPFHVVILRAMEKKLELIMSSDAEEEVLRELGEILRCSILPKNEIKIITSTLESFANCLTSTDEQRAANYLKNLAKELSSELTLG
ncbi:MAG: hypothetical protein WC849_01000 [Candidatus Paceibacterota bacterium]